MNARSDLGKISFLFLKSRTYYWAVRGFNADGDMVLSPVCSFTVTDRITAQENGQLKALAYPNPGKSRDMQILIDSGEAGRMKVLLYEISHSACSWVIMLPGSLIPMLTPYSPILLAVKRSFAVSSAKRHSTGKLFHQLLFVACTYRQFFLSRVHFVTFYIHDLFKVDYEGFMNAYEPVIR